MNWLDVPAIFTYRQLLLGAAWAVLVIAFVWYMAAEIREERKR